MSQIELTTEELAIIEARRAKAVAKQKKLSKRVQLRNALINLYDSLYAMGDDNHTELLANAKRVILLTGPKKFKKLNKATGSTPITAPDPLEQENIPA